MSVGWWRDQPESVEFEVGQGAPGPPSLPVSDITDTVVDSTTYDNVALGSGKMTVLVFPSGYTSAFAVAQEGDAFPRLMLTSDGELYFGDGTADPQSGGNIYWTGTELRVVGYVPPVKTYSVFTATAAGGQSVSQNLSKSISWAVAEDTDDVTLDVSDDTVIHLAEGIYLSSLNVTVGVVHATTSGSAGLTGANLSGGAGGTLIPASSVLTLNPALAVSKISAGGASIHAQVLISGGNANENLVLAGLTIIKL